MRAARDVGGMRPGPFRFSPGLLPSIAVVLLLGLFLSLGLWQLGRAEEKRVLLERFEASRLGRPLGADALTAGYADALRYRRVVLQGRFLTDRQFLLDNQVRQGQAGFEVLTPFRLVDGRVVLVNRGWLPMGARRDVLPDVSVSGAPVEIAGWIYIPFGEAYRLGDVDDPAAGWPRIVQDLDFDVFARRLDMSLLPMTIRLSAEAPAGYLRDWDVVPMTPAKHIAYAVQWLGMAAALLVIYVVVNLKREDAHE